MCREHQAQLEQKKAELLELRQNAAKLRADRDVATRALDDMRAFEARQAMKHSLFKVCIAFALGSHRACLNYCASSIRQAEQHIEMDCRLQHCHWKYMWSCFSLVILNRVARCPAQRLLPPLVCITDGDALYILRVGIIHLDT